MKSKEEVASRELETVAYSCEDISEFEVKFKICLLILQLTVSTHNEYCLYLHIGYYLQGEDCVSPLFLSEEDDFADELLSSQDDKTLRKWSCAPKEQDSFRYPRTVTADKSDASKLKSNKRKLDSALDAAFGSYIRPPCPKQKKNRRCVLCRDPGHDKRNCPLR